MDLLDLSAAEISQKCVDAFGRCLPTEPKGADPPSATSRGLKQAPTVDERLEYRLADFNLWVDGIGALASGKASLDWRLNSRPIDLTLVKSNLVMLLHAVEDYASAGKGAKSPDEALLDIDSSLSNLASLSLAIRRTGRRSRLHKADRLFNEKDHEELRRHLECIAVLRPQEDGRDGADFQEKMQTLTSAQNRLVLANLRRRNRFLQAHRHSRGLKKRELGLSPVPEDQPTVKEEPQEVPDLPKPERSASQVLGQLPAAIGKSTILPQAKIPGAPTMSGTSASLPESKLRFKDMDHKKLEASTPRTEITQIAATARYPKPRLSDPNQKIFQCPCCCQTLPIEDVKSNVKWRKHLTEDLCPYTCIIDNCPKPDMLYSTRTALEQHVRQDHPPTWQCPLCEDGPIFATMPDMMDHLHEAHPEATEDDGLEELIANSAQQRMGIDACPLCDETDYVDSPELIDHVLEHIHDFSLRALPWPRPIDVDIGGEVGSFDPDMDDASHVAKWIFDVQPGDDEHDNAHNTNSHQTLQLSRYDQGRLYSLIEEKQSNHLSPFFIDIFFADEEGDESSRATHQTSESSASSSSKEESFAFNGECNPYRTLLPNHLYSSINYHLRLDAPLSEVSKQPRLLVRTSNASRKTHLGLAVCYQTRLEQPDLPIYWMDHSTPESILDSYRILVSANNHLSSGLHDSSNVSLQDRGFIKEEIERSGKFLMVIDNVEDPETLVSYEDMFFPRDGNFASQRNPLDCAFPQCDFSGDSVPQVDVHMRLVHNWTPLNEYLPQCHHGPLLILTTDPWTTEMEASTECNELVISSAEEEEVDTVINCLFDGHAAGKTRAGSLLSIKLRQGIRLNSEVTLSTKLSFDSWAIAVAAAFIEDSQVNEKAKAVRVDKTLPALLERIDSLSNDRSRHDKPRVSDTELFFFEVIIPALAQRENNLFSWFSALAFLDPVDIPQAAVQTLCRETKEKEFLERKVQLIEEGYSYECYALILFDGRDKFSVHPDFLRLVLEWLRRHKVVITHQKKAIRFIVSSYPTDVVKGHKTALDYLRHAQRLLRFGLVDVQQHLITKMAKLVSETLDYLGKWNEAEEVLQQHYADLVSLLGVEADETLWFRLSLAKMHKDHHDFALAKHTAEQVVNSLDVRGLKDDKHDLALTSMVLLATVLNEEGEWFLAGGHAGGAVNMARRHGKEFEKTTGLAALLAYADASLGLGEDRLASEALAKIEEHSNREPANDPETLAFEFNLANVWRKHGKLSEAKMLHQSVLRRRGALGPDHPDTIKSWLAIAREAIDDGRYDEAEDLCKTAEASIRGQLPYGPRSNARIIEAYTLLARIHQERGDWNAAQKVLEEAYAEALDTLPKSHPLILAISEDQARTSRLKLGQSGFLGGEADDEKISVSKSAQRMAVSKSTVGKRFDPCLTCRERKVRCDESKPHCDRCKRAGLDCRGYNHDDADRGEVEERKPTNRPEEGPGPKSTPSFANLDEDPFQTVHLTCSLINIGGWNYVSKPGYEVDVSFSRDVQVVRYNFTSPWGSCRIEYPYHIVSTTSIRFPAENHRGSFLRITLYSAPSFYAYDKREERFSPCSDFTDDHRASRSWIHYLEGDMRDLSSELGFNSSVYENPYDSEEHGAVLRAMGTYKDYTQGVFPPPPFSLPSQPFNSFAAIASAFDEPPMVPTSTSGMMYDFSGTDLSIEDFMLDPNVGVQDVSSQRSSDGAPVVPGMQPRRPFLHQGFGTDTQPPSPHQLPVDIDTSLLGSLDRPASDPRPSHTEAISAIEPDHTTHQRVRGKPNISHDDEHLTGVQNLYSNETLLDSSSRISQRGYPEVAHRQTSRQRRELRQQRGLGYPRAERDHLHQGQSYLQKGQDHLQQGHDFLRQGQERLRQEQETLRQEQERLRQERNRLLNVDSAIDQPQYTTTTTDVSSRSHFQRQQYSGTDEMTELHGYPPPSVSDWQLPAQHPDAVQSSINVASVSDGPSFAPPQLPPGWIAQWDNPSRRYYFVNFSTGQTQWEVPTKAAPASQASGFHNSDLGPGEPQVITHPDGTQTLVHPGGHMEPIMPGTIDDFLQERFGYPNRQTTTSRTPEATLPYYEDRTSQVTWPSGQSDVAGSATQDQSQGPLAALRKTFRRRKDRTKK